ncbi:MAG: hypothetical protein IKV36_03550 [Clostridia bacterium]|nr:hypothetical protein [Clostridia bacterium]
MILDIHSHILPSVDDGAKDLSESLKILKMMKEQGADAVVATPHFDLAASDVLQKRDKIISQYNELCLSAKSQNLPEIYLGYELVFRYGMSENPELDKFTIAGTDKILIELPFGRITNKIVAELEEIAYARKLTPILAHLERYNRYEGIQKIYEVVENGDVKAQVTADTVSDFWDKMLVAKLMKRNVFTYLGSDAHSVDERAPKIDAFMKYANRHHKAFCEKMKNANKNLYKDMKKPTE